MPPMIRNSQKFKVLSSKKRRKSDKHINIIFPESLYRRMRSSFDRMEAVAKEGYAIAQCGYKADNARKNYLYLVKSIHIPEPGDLFEQSSITVTPGAEFMEGVLSEATETGQRYSGDTHPCRLGKAELFLGGHREWH